MDPAKGNWKADVGGRCNSFTCYFSWVFNIEGAGDRTQSLTKLYKLVEEHGYGHIKFSWSQHDNYTIKANIVTYVVA